MGYVLELRATDVDAVVGELTTPTLAVDDVDDALLPPAVRDNWDLLASTIADAVRTGGGTPEGSLATVVVAVITHHGHSWLPLHHSSIGGEVFRDEFVHGSLADLLGATAADHLLSRPIAGLVAENFPAWGHLTADEIAAVAERDLAVDPDHPDARDLHDVAEVTRRAARLGTGIATIHA